MGCAGGSQRTAHYTATDIAPRFWGHPRREGSLEKVYRIPVVSLSNNMRRLLIGLGVLFFVAGLLWPWLAKLPWGRFPGDIAIERDGFRFYLPLMTALVASLLLSLLFWWWRK